MTLHFYGAHCARCGKDVIPDDCDDCGQLHGSTQTDPRDLPDHDCEEAA